MTALAACLRERRAAGQRVCVVAGVDLAHVGRSFGDHGALTPEFMSKVEQRDRLLLGLAEARDRPGLLGHMAEDDDARRICGLISY